MSLDFSLETRKAATVFTEYRNSIDIYTEDCGKDKVFYVELFKKLLADTDVVVNDIYPLGCKNTVVETCKNDMDNRRKKLYIVDGDIYLQFSKKINLPNLHVLDAYCIENYMVCEESICYMAYKLYARDSYENIKKLLDIPQILANITKPLIDLFFYYSIQKECMGRFDLKSVECYMNMSTCEIDMEKINNKIAEIKIGLLRNGFSEDKINVLIETGKNLFPYSKETLLTIVSGKDFIIPFFKHHIHKCINLAMRLSKEAWKLNLLDKCDLVRLESLKQSILSA